MDFLSLLGYRKCPFRWEKPLAMNGKDRGKERTGGYKRQNWPGHERYMMEKKLSHSGDNLNLPMDYMRLVLENTHEAIKILSLIHI